MYFISTNHTPTCLILLSTWKKQLDYDTLVVFLIFFKNLISICIKLLHKHYKSIV